MALRAPERLDEAHILDNFGCRHESLTDWLKRRALQGQEDGSSNCFVICEERGDGKEVVAYYSLSMGSVGRNAMPSARMRRNMPDAVPVALIGRLAVSDGYERQGIGAGMLKDAVRRTLAAAADGPGVKALLCHAIDGDAKNFYIANGFVETAIDPMTLLLNLSDLARRLRESLAEK